PGWRRYKHPAPNSFAKSSPHSPALRSALDGPGSGLPRIFYCEPPVQRAAGLGPAGHRRIAMRPVWALTATAVLLCLAWHARADGTTYRATINVPEAEVRSGPGTSTKFYATNKLHYGDT